MNDTQQRNITRISKFIHISLHTTHATFTIIFAAYGRQQMRSNTSFKSDKKACPISHFVTFIRMKRKILVIVIQIHRQWHRVCVCVRWAVCGDILTEGLALWLICLRSNRRWQNIASTQVSDNCYSAAATGACFTGVTMWQKRRFCCLFFNILSMTYLWWQIRALGTQQNFYENWSWHNRKLKNDSEIVCPPLTFYGGWQTKKTVTFFVHFSDYFNLKFISLMPLRYPNRRIRQICQSCQLS